MRRSSLALLGLLLAGPVVWAALRQVRNEELWSLVRDAANAHARVSYAGEAAWRSTRWEKRVQIEHDAVSGRTRYRWSRRSSYVTHGPSSRSPDPAAWCLDLEAVQDNYRAEEREGGELLGRRTRTFLLRPLHEGRPSLQITLDARTSLPLKVVTFRSDGSLYKVAAFRTIEIGPRVVEQEQGSRRRGYKDWFGSSVSMERLGEQICFDPLLPEYLPEGFKLADCRVSGRLLPRLRLVYTDGLTTFELKQRVIPTPAQVEADYHDRFGSRWAAMYMRYYWRRCNDALVRSAGGSEGGTTVHRRKHGRHLQHELRVGDLEVELSCRADLATEETLRVLRSLRAK